MIPNEDSSKSLALKYSSEVLRTRMIKENLKCDTLYYCLVKKESDTGLVNNDRLLVLQ